MSPNISLEEILGIKNNYKNLFWLHRDWLLSLIDSKFLRHDHEGIGLGSNFRQTWERDFEWKVKLMRLRKILNLEKPVDVKLNETKTKVA
jgi:hypothetical protein